MCCSFYLKVPITKSYHFIIYISLLKQQHIFKQKHVLTYQTVPSYCSKTMGPFPVKHLKTKTFAYSPKKHALKTNLLFFCLTLRHPCLFFAFFACRRLPFPRNYKEMTFLHNSCLFSKVLSSVYKQLFQASAPPCYMPSVVYLYYYLKHKQSVITNELKRTVNVSK